MISCSGLPGGRGTERPGEAGRHEDVVGTEVSDAGVTQTHQRGVDAPAQDVEHVLHARLTGGRQAPQVGPPNHHRTRPQRHGLHHVTPPPDAAVEQDLFWATHPSENTEAMIRARSTSQLERSEPGYLLSENLMARNASEREDE